MTSCSAYALNMQDEINHLFSYIEKTKCLYERNGNSHTGVDAVKHIKKKHDHYKDEIKSAEKFIELSATKSMLSGKYYMINCKGKKEVKSRDWLLNELNMYRKTKS